MPPCRSTRKKSTKPSNAHTCAVSFTKATTQPAKKKGKKDSQNKSATQHITEDARAGSPVKLTRAEQNIVDDGTSVAPPKQICNAAVSLLPASETQVATSGHIHCSEVLENESTESENINEDTSAGENASNDSSDSSGSEFEEVSSKHNKSNEDTGNKTSKDTHNKGSEDTGNQTSKNAHNRSSENTGSQTSKDNHNESSENTGNQTSKDTHKDISNIESLSEHENADNHITDVHMASPPKTQTYNLQRSSHVTGGFMCHHAQDNVYNSADFLEIEKQSTYLEHVKGIIYLYISKLDPMDMKVINMKSMTLIKIPVSVNSMEPVMKGLAKKYDPIADSNQWFYVVDSDSPHWHLLGNFECAIEENEEFTWIQQGNHILHVLCSSFHPSGQEESTPITVQSHSASLSTCNQSVSMAPSASTEAAAESQVIAAHLGVGLARLTALTGLWECILFTTVPLYTKF
ncbi:hypothetical protein BDQ17DRAFT_1431160 [Cyathus striatus]|nr:hypothetical protein BDQ17DRAFT_1431160 [Cyathus striatus]